MRGRPRIKTEPKYRNNVAALRLRAGLTQEQLAEKAGIGMKALAKIDRGETRLNQRNMDQISRALGVPPTALLPDDTGPAPSTIAVPDDMIEEIARHADELAVHIADRWPAGLPLSETQRARMISDVAAMFRATAVQILKRGGRS